MKSKLQPKPNPKRKGFTLIEILIAVAIIGIITAISVPSLSTSKSDTVSTRKLAQLKTLNDAANRARIAGVVGPGTEGNDKVAALDWYIQTGTIRNENPPDIDGIYFSDGIWYLEPYNSFSELIAAYNAAQIPPIPGQGWFDPPTTFPNPTFQDNPAAFQYLLSKLGDASTPEELAFLQSVISGPEIQTMAILNGDPQFIGQASPWEPNLDPAQIQTLFDTTASKLTSNPNLQASMQKQLFNASWATTPTDLTALDFGQLTGVHYQTKWANTNVTSQQLNDLSLSTGEIKGIYAGVDMTGVDFAGRTTNGNFSGANNLTGAQLNQAAGYSPSSAFGNANLVGFDPTGKSIKGVNFFGSTNLTAAQIAKANDIQNINLHGTNISLAQLEAALAAESKTPTGNYDTSGIAF